MFGSIWNYRNDNSFKYKLVFSALFLFVQCSLCNQTDITNTTTLITSQTMLATSPGPLLSNSTSSVNSTAPSLFPPQKPPPALGLSCKNSSECKANFSSCTNNTCSCNSGYIPSIESLRCLKLARKLGDECSEDEQCMTELNSLVGPSICLNFACSCAIGMSLVEGKCKGPTVLNSKCNSDDDCSIQRSSCNNGLCSCLQGFVPNALNNLCLPVNIIQLEKLSGAGGCMEDTQCQEGMGDLAICLVNSEGNTCQCEPGSHIINNKCVKYKDLDEACSTDEECMLQDLSSENVGSRICNQSVCKCSSIGWTQVGNICKSGASEKSLIGMLFVLIAALGILDWN